MTNIAIRLFAIVLLTGSVRAQVPGQPPAKSPQSAATSAATVGGVKVPRGYVIGPEDVLTIVFWRDKDLSGDVRVRPDGRISLPLLNDVQAAGLTPEELRDRLSEAAAKFVQEPNATVVVKEIHSRNVYITGNVSKPGTYPLNGDMTVLQLIAEAGGLLEYADAKKLVIIRTENGRQHHLKFNYKDVIRQKHPEQNVTLQPGDTVVVP